MRAKGRSEEERETDQKVLGIPLFLRVYARYSLSGTWTQVTRRCTRHSIRCSENIAEDEDDLDALVR
jgi:hypothetical protein